MSSVLFLKEFIRSPAAVGAVLPSSRALAREIVRQAGVPGASVVVEFGPGTGAFTAEILRQLRRDAKFVAIEQNPAMVALLRRRFRDISIVADSAENVKSVLADRNLGKTDAIVSGLPWAAFAADLQDRLLAAAYDVLVDGGRFVTFAYLQGLLLPAGRRFRRKIDRRFKKVRTSRIVWMNFPPAIIYSCTK